MLIRHVPLAELERIAKTLGITFEGNDIGVRFPRVRGRLVPDRTIPKENRSYRRNSASWMNDSREVFAICWHGHRDFFRDVFSTYPEATIETGLQKMAGIPKYTSENFEENFERTDEINVGAPIFPRYSTELCRDCW